MDATQDRQSDDDAAGGRLVPLPRRRLGDDPDELAAGFGASPTATVEDLLERTDHLLAQLAEDIESLKADQAKELRRIEREAEEQQAAADRAIDVLRELAVRARRIAVAKARESTLDDALARPAELDMSVPFVDLVRTIEEEIRLAKGITGAIRMTTIGDLLKQATLRVEHMTEQAALARAAFIRETESELRSEGKEARASYEIGMSVVRRDLRALDLALPPSGLDWEDGRWAHWEGWDPLSGASRWVRVGTFFRPDLARFRFPALVEIPGERGLLIDVAAGARAPAVDALTSVLVRILASIPPGDVRFTFVDPVGLGESVAPLLALGAYQPELVDHAVCTTEEAIEEKFAELTRHIEHVIQTHLRGEFDTIEAANDAAGEVLEPYRVLAVYDFPQLCSDRAQQQLRHIIDNGPRCGVHTVMTSAPGAARAHGSRWKAKIAGLEVITGTPAGFRVIRPEAGEWAVELDTPPDLTLGSPTEPTLFGRLVATVGEQACEGRARVVTMARVFELLADSGSRGARDDVPYVSRPIVATDPTTWWSGRSHQGLAVPIGRSGSRDVACLALDSAARTGAVVGGEAGSGVSNLLHDIILGLAMIYPPEELALYLVDFTVGADAPFELYATEALPHARVVAVDAEREFGVSVLDGLVREMTRRSMLFAPHGGERAGIEGYRRDSGDPLARIVLVMDGIERLFSTDDRLADRAAHLLDALARQGGAHGIHLVVSTHAMVTLERLGRHTFEQLSVRVALACSDEESRRILGADDGAASRFDRAGAAVVTTFDGPDDHARPFQAAWLERHEQGLALRDLRRLADERNWLRRPQVFEGNAPARLEDSGVFRLGQNAHKHAERLQPRLLLGEPVALGGPVETTLHRDAGANLLVVGRDARLGQGLVFAAVASALLGHGRELDVRVLDFMPIESGFAESMRALEPLGVQVFRRRQVDDTLAAVHDEIARRIAGQDFRARPLVFVVDGLGQAPEFDVRGSKAGPGDTSSVARLEAIVRDGPEVGVHTVLWADSPTTLADRVSRATVRAFAARAVLQLPAADSALLIDSGAAASLKENQALLYDEQAARLTKLRPYLLPTTDFLRSLVAQVQGVEKPGPTAGIEGPRSTVSA